MKGLAVIFDMDGVLVDNTQYHIKAWKSFCSKYSLAWNETSYYTNINGRRLQEGIPSLFGKSLNQDAIEAYAYEKDAIYRDLYKSEIKPLQGLVAFLNLLTAHSVPKAIATSANELNIRFTLENTGISHFFDTILDETSIVNGKPDPGIYLKAARKLNMPPDRCVVFEDSLAGIQAARNAGMKVVGLATTHSREKLLNVDLIKDNFEDITINTLESLFI